MTKFIALVLLAAPLICLSCSESAKKTPPPSKQELLQGDWTTEKYSRDDLDNNYFHINVRDSIFTLFSNYSDSAKFKIQGDLLTVIDSSNAYYFGTHQKYKLVKITSDELILVAKSNHVRKRLRAYDWNSDTLTFKKVTKKNNLSPKKILFSASGCYGSCPMLKISIDSQRNVKFYGHGYTDILGANKGKITKNEYNLIKKQINQLPLDSLKPEYEAPWTDDQTRKLIIETSDTIIRTSVYGTYLEPVELTLLLQNLADLYKRAQLKNDSTVHDQEFFDHYLEVHLPPEIPELSF